MNIEIRDNKTDLLKKICKETETNPSQLMELIIDVLQNLYSDYERQKNNGIKEGSFKDFLTDLFLDKANLRTPDIEKSLIEGTNELLGIKEYNDAIVLSINPDFYERSFSYSVGYEYCIGVSNTYAYKGLVLEVEMNQDHIEVSHVVYMPTFESKEITDKRIDDTSNLVQEFFKGIYREEFSPFVNIEVKILPIRYNPYNLSEPIKSTAIKLVVKADKAENIPSIEKIGLIAEKVHFIVIEELNLNE